MIDTLAALLVRKLEERKSSTEQFLASGRIKSYEEYMKVTGYYEGINEAILEVKELEKRLLED